MKLMSIKFDKAIMILALSFALIAWPSARADDQISIETCSQCSGFQLMQAAIDAAQFASPFLQPVQTAGVYVINPLDRIVQFYLVTQIYTDPDPALLGDESLATDAVATPGDPAIIADVHTVFAALDDFQQFMTQNESADELDLPFDSALDLVGPVDSTAGLNRTILQNRLESRSDQFFNDLIIQGSSFLGDIFGGVFSDAGVVDGNTFWLEFGDGSTVKIEIVQVSEDPTEFANLNIEFDVLEDTAQVTGQIDGIPQSPGQLSNFSITTPNIGLSNAFRDLIRRLGVGFDDSGPVGECSTITCVAEPPNGTPRCTRTFGPC